MNKYIVYYQHNDLAFCKESLYPQMLRAYHPTFVVGVFYAENQQCAKTVFKTTNWFEGRSTANSD